MLAFLRTTAKLLLMVLLIYILLVTAQTISIPNVEAQPVVFLSSQTARTGVEISIRGTGFLPTDISCTLSSPSSSALVTSAVCITQDGSVSGGFIVGNVMPGEYVFQASGNLGDFAQTILDVSGGAQIGLSPATSAPGMDVSVRGSGFQPTDTTCSISSPSTPDPILLGSAACVIQSGTDMAVGGFIIGNVSPGEYVIQLTGNSGDSAQALLDVA